MKVTEAEILAELHSAIERSRSSPNDAFTTGEMAELLGVGDGAIRKRLKQLSKAGRLIPVRIMRPDLTGNKRLVWGYRISPETVDERE